VNMTQLAKDFGISRETLYQYKRDFDATSPCH
jgi:DNA-binding phage protein